MRVYLIQYHIRKENAQSLVKEISKRRVCFDMKEVKRFIIEKLKGINPLIGDTKVEVTGELIEEGTYKNIGCLLTKVREKEGDGVGFHISIPKKETTIDCKSFIRYLL